MTAADREIQRRFQNFVQKYHGKKLVVLELGIGWRNQLIKAPLMNLVKKEPYAAYITINKGEIYIPDEIVAKSYGRDGDMTEILERLKEALEERNEGDVYKRQESIWQMNISMRKRDSVTGKIQECVFWEKVCSI